MATGCPYQVQSNHMCSILIQELIKADCWKDMENIIDAILMVRLRANEHIEEWQHLHSPNPTDKCQEVMVG